MCLLPAKNHIFPIVCRIRCTLLQMVCKAPPQPCQWVPAHGTQLVSQPFAPQMFIENFLSYMCQQNKAEQHRSFPPRVPLSGSGYPARNLEIHLDCPPSSLFPFWTVQLLKYLLNLAPCPPACFPTPYHPLEPIFCPSARVI